MAIDEFVEIKGSELIQDTFLFRNLNFEEAQALAKLCRREQFPAGAVIIEENALGQALYLVEAGEVKVVKGEGQEQREVARLKRGELFGEMSLIENELTSASVIAAGPVTALVIHRDRFEDLMEDNETLALKIFRSFCRMISERLRRSTDELSKLRAAGSKPVAPAQPKPKAKAPKAGGKK